MLSVVYYIVLLVFTLVYFVLFCVIFMLTVLFDRRRAVVHVVSRWWSKSLFRLNPRWKMRVEGLEKIDRSKPYVIIVNHQSMVDIPLLYELPLNFRWVSKREVYKWPIFGAVLWMHGDIAIERGAKKGARRMLNEGKMWVERGVSVAVFPEGTRSKTGHVGKFRDGAFVLAKHAGVGILPCVSDGTGNMSVGWKLRMPHRFVVKVLDPVSAEEVASSDTKELAMRLQKITEQEHEKLVAERQA